MAVWLCSEGLRWSCCGPYFRHHRWLQQLHEFRKIFGLRTNAVPLQSLQGFSNEAKWHYTIPSDIPKAKVWMIGCFLMFSQCRMTAPKACLQANPFWHVSGFWPPKIQSRSLEIIWVIIGLNQFDLIDWNKLRTLPSNGHSCGSWLESLWDRKQQFVDIPTASA